MRLKTSLFNPTVLKKDITRFAPVWALYSILVGLALLLIADSDPGPAQFANSASVILIGMGIVNFLYAPLNASLLFGDLFQSRMCNALHALPLRREGWFLTHLTAGMLFSLVPNALAALICCTMLQQYSYMAFLWLAVMVLQYLFFFGAAVFAVHCAGNRLGGVAVYGIFNFLSVIFGWFAYTFYEPLLYGVKFNFLSIAKYSPVVQFSTSEYLNTDYDNMTDVTRLLGFYTDQWVYLGIAAALGAVLLGLAVLLYRKRQLESAGDLIAWRPAAPVFLVIYTLGVGAVFYLAASLFGTGLEYFFLLVGFAIGFFTGKMLLEKRVRVFRPRAFLAFGILVAVFAASLGITAMDPFGVVRYVPESDAVESVMICDSHGDYRIRERGLTLTAPADIEKILEIHEQCVDARLTDNGHASPLYIRYTLAGGTQVERYYYVSDTAAYAGTLAGYFSKFQVVFGVNSPEEVLKHFYRMELSYYGGENLPSIAVRPSDEDYSMDESWITYSTENPEGMKIVSDLLYAMERDCEAGYMAPSAYNIDQVGWMNLAVYQADEGVYYRDIPIYRSSFNTIEYLKTLPPLVPDGGAGDAPETGSTIPAVGRK